MYNKTKQTAAQNNIDHKMKSGGAENGGHKNAGPEIVEPCCRV